MAVQSSDQGYPDEAVARVVEETMRRDGVATPAAFGPAGLAVSTWVVASWLVGWWGGLYSPGIIAPCLVLCGGLAELIVGFMGYPVADALARRVHALWGSFWITSGLLFLNGPADILAVIVLNRYASELACWLAILTVLTGCSAVASAARGLILCSVFTMLAIGATIACYSFARGNIVDLGRHVAYFWMASAFFAWWRVTVYLLEEALGGIDS